jgi:SAM-dependent methyltransferase
MTDSRDRQIKWNQRYASLEGESLPQPADVLQNYQHLLPKTGVALDLACGLGGNALYLAQRGLETYAWDVSSVAIEKLTGLAASLKVLVHAQVRDVVNQPPPAHSYDVIVVSRFLHRPLIPNIVAALKSSGLVFYQTFIQEKTGDIGPSNPEYLLAENELLKLFSGLRILDYREEGLVGNTALGFRHEAMLVGQKKAM